MPNPHISSQIEKLSPKEHEKYAMQIRGGDGSRTRWLNITYEQLKVIEVVLSN